MSKIEAIEPAAATGAVREDLAAVARMFGGLTPNMFRVAAQSEVALGSLLALFRTASRGRLPAAYREAIALAVAESNGCDYCLSAHTALAKGAGLDDAAIGAARDAHALDPKLDALLGFVRELVLGRGVTGEGALERLRAAGVADAEVLEAVTHVALNVLTNYVNIVAGTDVDFPLVRGRR